jgi:flagellar motility protein MotE (MotC chaperone)
VSWLLNKLGTAFVYFCTGTVLAATIALVYLGNNGVLTRPKLVRMLAIAHDIDMAPFEANAARQLEEDGGEQASYDDIEELRAHKSRDLDIKLQSIAVQLKEFQHLAEKLKTDRERYEIVRAGFKQELEEMKENSTAGGMAEVRRALEAVKPRQAKDQILRMVQRGEIDQVVVLFSEMESNKRAKIFTEFKEDAESQIMSDILRLIRVGGQQAQLIDSTLESMNRASGLGSKS